MAAEWIGITSERLHGCFELNQALKTILLISRIYILLINFIFFDIVRLSKMEGRLSCNLDILPSG
jgi:hypothetical protein